jgi:transposase
MGNARGFKRDADCFKTLEQRRLKAARLLQQGVHQSEVARRVGVHRQSVSRWARQLEEAGRAGLKRARRAGRKPKLTTTDLKRLEQGLKRGPEALGYATSLWTSQRVAHLIEQECGVRYTTTHVWRLLKQLGWSCQRPVGRALERDEEAIRRWKKRRWPELKKTPLGKTKPSFLSTKAD